MERSSAPDTDPPIRPLPARPLHAGGEIAVQFLTAPAEFAALAPEWNRLHEEAAAASVFNSWIWQYHWWQVYGSAQPLRVLVALERGAMVGILPVYIQAKRALGVRARLLRFVGTGGDTGPDDLGPVLAPGREARAAAALANALLRVAHTDVYLFTDIDPDSLFAQALTDAAGAAGLRVMSGLAQRISFIRLPASWDAFLKALPSKRRSGIRCARAKLLATHPDAHFFVWDEPARLDRAIDRLAALHRKRWQAAGASHSFATAQYMDFHRGLMHSLMRRGWLRLYCLEIGGELRAITYCYRLRNRVFCMQAGFDPAFARVAPGAVLLGYAIQHAIAEGNEVFDFLRGEHMYKDQLANGTREARYAAAFRPNARALAYRLRRVHLPAWKARLHGGALPTIEW
ncbi:MAG TPA: GNAT family N-acetyltransferase [Burkholderiales bacterium]|nr:GNAT family N-acetyltransferase [Burkholderiales bacterium]